MQQPRYSRVAIIWSLKEYDCVPSTQSTLKDLIENNTELPEGIVIHAKRQTNGYGRHGRVWEQGDGNLYLSFLVKPKCSLDRVGQLSLLTGLALSDTIDKYMPAQKSTLKWPNDVMVNNKKCAGILIEAAPIKDNRCEYFIIGVGVNIKSAPLDIATSLETHSTQGIDVKEFRDIFLSRFSEIYNSWQIYGFEDIHAKYLEKTYERDTEISVKLGSKHIEGKFESIDMDGNLLLMCNEKIKRISSGEIYATSN